MSQYSYDTDLTNEGLVNWNSKIPLLGILETRVMTMIMIWEGI
jgi:hypothetical protein